MKKDVYFYQSGTNIVQFDGELIAHVSSELPSKQRWTEFDLFLTAHQEWVLQGIGRSNVEGETDRYWSIISKDVTDVLQGILGNECSRLAKKLLALSFHNLAVEEHGA